MLVLHEIKPVFNHESRILVLGSFPSVKSREANFFYNHPQNRFWKVTSKVFGDVEPKTVEEKREFLLRNKIAVWDVIASCEIEGSADSTIRSVTANDLRVVLDNSKVDKIFLNGKTAEKYYKTYIKDKINKNAICLPSTSPANAAWSVEKLVEAWKIIKGNNLDSSRGLE